MSRKIVFCMALISFLLMAAVPANADSSSLFRHAGTVEPVENNNVHMAEEKVDIKVYSGWSVVRCEFIFKNESQEAQDVLMGFPASIVGEGMEIDATTKLIDFKIFDNETEKESKLENASWDSNDFGKVAEWHTWNVHFQGGEERKIVNTYKTQNYNAPWGRHTGYILKTGAPWKGTIGKAVITFELMDIAPTHTDAEYTNPKGYRVDKNKIIWEMKDFEPTEDISLALSGYWSLYGMLHGQNEEYINSISKKIEQAKMLFIGGNEEEALKQIDLLLDQGVYAEDLYFCLLNYYHKRGNIDEFINILKDEIQNLNNPYVLEWAEAIYPDRLKAEGISYPQNHKPIIKNQQIRKLDEKQFELSADLYDAAGDMIFLSGTAYTDPITMSSILEYDSSIIVFGYKEYEYKAKGKLPEPYEDLVWRLEINDYKGDFDVGMTLDADRIGESCYFYDGDIFIPWILKKDAQFSLCYYDKSFDALEEGFRKTLADRINGVTSKLDIKVPAGGYTINLYDKSHLDKLKKDSPQNITLYLKTPEYRAKLHNDKIAGKSEKQSMEEWDWGEIIVGIDSNNLDKMADGIVIDILADTFGLKWQNVKPEIADAFIAAISAKKGEGRYYKTFSNMTKAELINAAQEIGSTGEYMKSVNNPMTGIIILLVMVGVIYLVYKSNIRISR